MLAGHWRGRLRSITSKLAKSEGFFSLDLGMIIVLYAYCHSFSVVYVVKLVLIVLNRIQKKYNLY